MSASELVGKYISEGCPSEVFDFVRPLANGERIKSQVRLRLLRAEEDLDALRSAQRTAKTNGETGDYGDIYKEAQAHEVLARAVCSVEQHNMADGTKQFPPLCVSADHLRRAFSASELAVLLNCYHITKAKFGPLESLEKEAAETWIARLSDPLRGPFFLSQLDSLQWPGLIALLATMCRDLYQAAGLELPSLEPTSTSDRATSTPDTGSSTVQPSASSTERPEVRVPADKLLTSADAAEILSQRKK